MIPKEIIPKAVIPGLMIPKAMTPKGVKSSHSTAATTDHPQHVPFLFLSCSFQSPFKFSPYFLCFFLSPPRYLVFCPGLDTSE
jgi:hypothetical protein